MSYEDYETQGQYAEERPINVDVIGDLLGFGTETDDEFLKTARGHTTFGELGEALGITALSAYQRFCRVRRKAAKKGAQPGLNPGLVGEGFSVVGRSFALDESGNITKQWVRTDADKEEQQEAMREALEDYFKPLRDVERPLPGLVTTHEVIPDLLAVYPMGDPHIGMYAWFAECGQDFDLYIAEDNLRRAVDVLIAKTEPAYTALLCNVGDYYHADNFRNVTSRSGHALDVDGRWGKVLKTGANIQRYMVERLLEKHVEVIVWNVPGNHDDQSAVALNLAQTFLWENEERVTIEQNDDPFFYYRHGEVLLASTHGDKPKMAQLPGIMATDRKEDWGLSTYRHWYTGHVHHDRQMAIQEYPGVTVESLRTLAPKDIYSHSHGYRAMQEMKSDTWHRKHGRVGRAFCSIQQVWDGGGKGAPR